MAINRSTRAIEPTITPEEFANYCRWHSYAVRDTLYTSNPFNVSVSPHVATARTVYACTCGWTSYRRGCPLHV